MRYTTVDLMRIISITAAEFRRSRKEPPKNVLWRRWIDKCIPGTWYTNYVSVACRECEGAKVIVLFAVIQT